MKRFAIIAVALLAFVAVRAQNQELENLLQKYRSNPSIEHTDLMESFPNTTDVKVGETFDFGDSIYLVRHFYKEFKRIKGYKKLKPSKVLNLEGNVLVKMALNKAISIRRWESENGYKDTVMEFDGCIYAIIHLGGYYKDEEIGNFIKVNNLER